jgi:two-component system response regulator (stage 0 sporulation protein F)
MWATSATLRVLLAEDDPDMRALVRAALMADGHDVIEAANGREALDLLSPLYGALRPPDVIVTDVRMPGLSGLLLASGLRACGCTTPIIIISAHCDGLREQARRVGADAVFAKPFEVDDLRTAVMNVTRPYFRARANTLPDPNQL